MTIKDKNILFIIPPYFNIDYYRSGETNYTLPAFTVPYGLLSMEAYIRKHAACNVKMEILDLNLEVFKIIDDMCNIHDDLFEILAKKLEDKTDIVGISAIFNSAYNYIGDIVSIVKKAVNPPMCLLGGGLATNLYTKILNTFLGIDGICFAEGEIPMVDLINAKDPYEVLSDHPSWITAESITTGRAPVSSFVKNLDDIPIFTYDSICLDDYNTRSLDKKHNTETTKRELSIHTSRGCPFDCIYCANASSHGKKIRFMSVERVIAEVDDMIEKYGMNVLLVEDDHFLANKERTVKILKALGQRNIRIEFPNGLAVYKIDEEIGELLKFAGATTVQLAVESGSDYVLNQIIKKPHKSSQVKSAADILKKNDIIVHAFIVIGLPGEMDEHRQETMRLLYDVGFDWVYFFIATPVVGSRLYDICIEKGYLANKNFENHLVNKGNIKAPGVDPIQIEETSYLMNLEINFLNNHNIKTKQYDKAEAYFQNIIAKYPNHAFAYYVLAKLHKQKKQSSSLSQEYFQSFQKILREDDKWSVLANHFNLDRSHV